MLKASVIGATGYAGQELVRILSVHPGVRLCHLASESHAGVSMGQVYPHLNRNVAMECETPDIEVIGRDSDVVFFCLPPGHAMDLVPKVLEAGARVIDLGADFRLKDPEKFRKWYGETHACPHLLDEAEYGLPELHRDDIGGCRLVANPGCYPTAAILGVAPLLKTGLLDGRPMVIDAKSGVSGAGRALSLQVHFSEVNENMTPYGVGGHRHLPEMIQEMGLIAGRPVSACFTPHIAPVTRGILCTIYIQCSRELSQEEATEIYTSFYKGEPFVEVLNGSLPSTKHVLGSNNCHVAVRVDENTGMLIVIAAIDNLVKGAAGQAVQNMNILFGLAECAGLKAISIFP
jgi:N-acetyl-gamma-glutamyl-phosphate reductase